MKTTYSDSFIFPGYSTVMQSFVVSMGVCMCNHRYKDIQWDLNPTVCVTRGNEGEEDRPDRVGGSERSNEIR